MADFSGAVLGKNGGEVTGDVLDGEAVLEKDVGLVQEGDFDRTGTGVGGDLSGGVGCGGCFTVVGGSWGFGATGQGGVWDFEG